MTKFQGRYRIASTRLPGWDYTCGWYFITVCTQRRSPFLGSVADGAVQLSPAGEIVADEWQRTALVRSNVLLDAWVVMPDHFHGIIAIHRSNDDCNDSIVEPPRRGGSTMLSLQSSPAQHSSRLSAGSLGAIVGQWKSIATKRIRAAGYADFAWQARFYDGIIRGEPMLASLRKYISANPQRWEADRARSAGVWM